MLARRKESQGVWVRETVCLGILVNPSELYKYTNVCVCGCGYTETKRENSRVGETKGKIRLKKRIMRWLKLEPIIQSEVSQKDKDQYSILTHIYGI